MRKKIWLEIWDVIKVLLLFVPVLVFVYFRRGRNILDGGGVQPDTTSSDAIRDGIDAIKDGIDGSKGMVDESIGNIDESIKYTDNAIGAIREARDILERAKRRTRKDN